MTETIRLAEESELPELRQIAIAAIGSPSSDYNERQTSAWLASFPEEDAWLERLSEQQIVVALSKRGGATIGFMTLRNDGLIDFAFILPLHQGQGHFRALVEKIEAIARIAGMPRLSAKASRNAINPFIASGFTKTGREVIALDTVELERFHVLKELSFRSKVNQ